MTTNITLHKHSFSRKKALFMSSLHYWRYLNEIVMYRITSLSNISHNIFLVLSDRTPVNTILKNSPIENSSTSLGVHVLPSPLVHLTACMVKFNLCTIFHMVTIILPCTLYSKFMRMGVIMQSYIENLSEMIMRDEESLMNESCVLRTLLKSVWLLFRSINHRWILSTRI